LPPISWMIKKFKDKTLIKCHSVFLRTESCGIGVPWHG